MFRAKSVIWVVVVTTSRTLAGAVEESALEPGVGVVADEEDPLSPPHAANSTAAAIAAIAAIATTARVRTAASLVENRSRYHLNSGLTTHCEFPGNVNHADTGLRSAVC